MSSLRQPVPLKHFPLVHAEQAPRRARAVFMLAMGLFISALGGVTQAQTTSGDATAGGTTFAANCNGCHSSATSSYAAVQNGANAGRIIQQALIGGMNGYTDGSFTSTVENNLAAYIAQSRIGSIATQSVTHNVNKTITITNMRFGSAYSNLNSLVIGGTQARGVVTATTTTAAGEPQVIYNPDSGQCGTDSFTVQGTSSTTSRSTNVRTINVSIANPAPPVISSGSTGSANYNTFTSNAYTTTTTGGAPLSYTATGLPPGLAISSTTGVVSGTPTAAGTYNATISARNCLNGNLAGQQDSQAVTFTVTKDSQTISFAAQTTPSRVYVPSGTFAISPVATATSGLAVSYTSGNTSVCTVSGTTVTMVGVGTCPIQAQQAGNGNFNAATTVTQNVTITQASQTITFGAQSTPRNFVSIGSSFAVSPTATASSGLAIAYSSGNTAVCTVSGSTVFMQSAGTCPIRANQSGNTNYTAATQVTQNVVINAIAPTAPQSPGGSVGDGQVTVTFSAPSNTGGSPITSYLVSCSPAGSASGATSPIVVTGLTNGVSHSCAVRATNAAALNSLFSAAVNLTPQATPVAPVINSPATETFTVGVFGSHQVTATGVPTPSISLFSGTLPSGISFTPASGLLGGKAAPGTAGAYPLTFRATNSAGTVDQVFTLTIKKLQQTITFPAISDTMVDGNTVAMGATSDSGLAVTYSIAPASVSQCSVEGQNVTKLAAGTCTVLADQAGDADYSPANQVSMSFEIALGSQTLNFPAQTVASQPFSGSTTFALNPVATASSGLAVTYSSLTPSVCTIAGTTITKVDVGTCTIQANQAGSAGYSPAAPVTSGVEIVQGSQTITFASTQPAQSFSAGGTFAISPLATASSGLSVVYSSTTTDVCLVSGTTVTIASSGNCVVAANQAGNVRYAAAAQMNRTIVINPVVPGAPVLTGIVAAPGQVTLQFDPPTNTGGTGITSYSAQCNPGAISNTGASSPIVVSGLTNGVAYTCTVSAVNSVGTGAASNSLQATPQGATGASIWNSVCTECHNQTPSGMQLNGAGQSGTVLQHVRSNVPNMVGSTAVQGLSLADLALVAEYINSNVPNIVVTTTPGVAKTISVSSHVTFSGSVAFNAVEVVSPPSNGTLGSWFAGGRSITYTPAGGFSGTDSFTYRPKHTTTGLLGDARTITIQVTSSTATLSVLGAGTGEGVVNSTPFGVYECYISAATQLSGVCNNVLFPAGTSVTLAARFLEGSAFFGWSGVTCAGGNGNPTCTFTLSSATSVTANFGPEVSPLIAKNDLNDDGKGDIVWRNAATGENYFYPMDGRTILPTEGNIRSVPAPWVVAGVGDFDGDGKADLLWRNTSTGENYIYFMDGKAILSSEGFIRSVPTSWTVGGVADFDGDGKADILWRNTSTGENYLYFMDGKAIKATEGYTRSVAIVWVAAAVADFDGDGKADILWRNTSTGENYLYPMDGKLIKATEGYIRSVATNWIVAGSGDFTGDGKADILWRNTSTGENYLYPMDGRAILATEGFIRSVATNWIAASVADYDGDGKVDILWRNTGTGENYIYPMDGRTIKATEGFIRSVSTAWSVVTK